jgi:hypothetical protein
MISGDQKVALAKKIKTSMPRKPITSRNQVLKKSDSQLISSLITLCDEAKNLGLISAKEWRKSVEDQLKQIE